MSKKIHSQKQAPPSSHIPWLWLVIGASLLLITGGLLFLGMPPGTESGGTPQLVVDQTIIDEGYQTFNTPVQTAFRLRNVGDGALYILGEPQVELAEGC